MTKTATKRNIERARRIVRDALRAYEKIEYGEYDRDAIDAFMASFDDSRAIEYTNDERRFAIINDAIEKIYVEYDAFVIARNKK